MGWTFACNAGYGKKDLVADLRNASRFGETTEMLRSSVVGNNHWYLARNRDTGNVWIGLDRMQGGGRESGWGHKSMSEGCGPCYYDCPLSMLEQASEPTGYAIEWRQKVRAHHAQKAARPVLVAGLVVNYFKSSYRLIAPAGPRRGWSCVDVATGMQYRISTSQLARATV